MATDGVQDYLHPNLATRAAWPDYAQTWLNDTVTYPTGRGQDKPQRGWVCSGCGAGYAPWVASCGHCKPEAKRTAPEPRVMGEWEDET